MRPKAIQTIEYAIEHKLDSVLFNSFKSFASLEPGHLAEVNELAKANHVSVYIGAFCISETSTAYRGGYENAEARLKDGIRVATAVSSPIVATRIGGLRERYMEGGIEAHIREVIRVMKAMRGPALDAGVKFAMENHGELRSEELLRIIHETGPDVCGALFDPNNTLGVMDDPERGLKILGEHILCTSARDFTVYESEEGATSQSTAIGQGMLDFKHYTEFFAQNCPGVPIHVETIGSAKRSIPFLKPEFWDGFAGVPASGISDFLKRIKQGSPVEIPEPPAGMDKDEFYQEQQLLMLQQSLDYLRRECGAGLKS
jgi:sugar phosphate isomerase/epimerase